jgi:hypothetical protein
MSSETTAGDLWRGLKPGDRFYMVAWNSREGDDRWVVVTDLWFDPVKGEHRPKLGAMVAVSPLGIGDKRALTVGTLLGRGYVRVREEELAAQVAGWLERLA